MQLLSSINIWTSYFLAQPSRRLIYAVIKGLCLSLTLVFIAQNQFEFLALLVWVALVPVIILAKSSSSYRQLILEAFLFFFAYYLVAFHWLFSLHPLTWQGFSNSGSITISVLAWISPAIFHSLLALSLPLSMKFILEQKNKKERKLNSLTALDMVILSFIWVLFQYKIPGILGELGIFNVPLHLLAYSQIPYSQLIQICNIIGALGLEFLIIFSNLLISNYFNIKTVKANESYTLSNFNLRQPSFNLYNISQQNLLMILMSLIMLAVLYYGQQTLKEPLEQSKLRYAIVNAGFKAAASRGKELSPNDLINRLKEDSLDLRSKNKLDLLIWPEGAVPLALSPESKLQLTELESITELLVFGTYHKARQNIFNSIAFYDFQNKIQFYDKQNLVPFGEYTPWTSLLPAPLKNLASSAIGNGFNRGTKNQELINTPHGKIAANICFEILFPELVRREINKGARFIINVNDLSWFNSKAVQHSFIAAAKFRAIENRSPIFLASNVGKNLLIDPHGNITKDLRLSQHKSIYTDYAW